MLHKFCFKIFFSLVLLFVSSTEGLNAQVKSMQENEVFWRMGNEHSIVWDLRTEKRLPHKDDIEMDGEKVVAIIHYEVDARKRLHVKREVIFPQLRRFIKATDPDYVMYRAYLKDDYGDELLPVLTCDNKILEPGTLDSVRINGMIHFFHNASQGISIKRSFFPSPSERLLIEKWTIRNTTDSIKTLTIGHTTLQQQENGLLGVYKRSVYCDAENKVSIQPGKAYEFAIYFSAALNNEELNKNTFQLAEQQRNRFLDTMRNNFVLHTPDSVLNTLFYFSKIRAAESIYETSMGLVHSPGGGRYYTGVWANDQAEYSGPFFPYLGYEKGTQAAMNTYRKFLQNIPRNGGKIWASFEMDGQLPCCSKDRGDAAMILFGATHFLLASGNRAYADELWPLLEWCVTYCEKMKNNEGVIASQSDELEGRFPTGTANLSTSSLYYGGLVQLGTLAKAMGKQKKLLPGYQTKAAQLRTSIEQYFGANVEGFNTYKYYKENTTLRSWICLPLVMGLQERKEGTLNALFTALWTNNGVLVESQPGKKEAQVFWDRGTLYAFRGAFKGGATDRALQKLTAFSNSRLLGFHVPYVVEAWPEGSMAHLSAESALYCRIFSEGLFGLTPAGFRSFTLQPALPTTWTNMQLNNIKAFGGDVSIEVKREGDTMRVIVSDGQRIIVSRKVKQGEEMRVNL